MTGDREALIWSASLRAPRRGRKELKSDIGDLVARKVAVDIGAVLNFSILIRVNVYESRNDFVIKNLQFKNCI